jgi:acyl carrier protein
MITLEKLQEIVVATGIEVKDGGIDPEKTFRENGIDSLDTMTLFLNIEEATGIKFSEEEVEGIKTLKDVLLIAKERSRAE